MNTDIMRRYVEVKTLVEIREAETKPLQEEMDALEARIIDELQSAEVDSVTVKGITLYRYTQRWASRLPEVTATQALAALRDAGLGEFVSEGFSTQTLSAWLRERVDQNEEIPEAVKSAFMLREVPKLGARRRNEA